MSTTTFPIFTPDGSMAYVVIDRNGRRFGASNNKGRALRLAARLGGKVLTELFGETVEVTV